MNLRDHIETLYTGYTGIFGHNQCTQSLRQFLDLKSTLTDRKNYKDGYIVASAIAWHIPSDRILRVYHAKIKRLVYSAGGGIDDNELPHEAAARELLQETGIRGRPVFDKKNPIPLIISAHTFPQDAIPGKPSHPLYDLIYLFTCQNQDVKPDPKEVESFSWDLTDHVNIEYSNTNLRNQMLRYLEASYQTATL
jgi:8-oxo-dGTP pyrophosphatase MutT (NUDIX family)